MEVQIEFESGARFELVDYLRALTERLDALEEKYRNLRDRVLLEGQGTVPVVMSTTPTTAGIGQR